MLTYQSLKRRVQKLLRTPKLSITLENLPNWKTADSEWSRDGEVLHLKIRADVDRFALIPCVIHELIHVALEDEIKLWDVDHNIEEAVVSGIEDFIWNEIKDKQRQINWWRKAINAKLK